MGIMKNWTIGKQLIFGFVGVMLTTLCLNVYTLTRLDRIESRGAALFTDSLPGVILMGQIAALSERESASMLQHIRANEAKEVRKADEELQADHERLNALFKSYGATVSGTQEYERFQRLNAIYSAYLIPFQEVLQLSRAQKDKEAYDLYDQQLKPISGKLFEGINEALASNTKSAEAWVRRMNNAARKSKNALIVGLIVSFILALLICHSVLRSINWLIAQVQRSALQVASSVTQISATAKEHQATSAETASATSEIGATSKEIAATSKMLLRTINDVTDVAEQTANLGGTGQNGLARMEATMRGEPLMPSSRS
jgi:methyl-accepting chemotaxis protein WspA